MKEAKGSTKADQRGFADDRSQLMRPEVAKATAEDAIPPTPISF